MNINIRAALFTFLLFLPLGLHAQMDREKDIQRFTELMESGNWANYKEAAQLLEWAGLSDPRIFDLVEKELLEMHAGTDKSGNDYDLISWLMKALSFSGDSKYHDTVLRIANEAKNKKVRKYARESLEQFSKYKEWNPIINSTENYNANESPEINRFANMLRSGEFELMRLAAKRIHYDHIYNDYLMGVLAGSIEANIETDFDRGVDLDSMAWMCKALGGARSEKYKPLLQKVASTAKTNKVRSYARKYLGYYE